MARLPTANVDLFGYPTDLLENSLAAVFDKDLGNDNGINETYINDSEFLMFGGLRFSSLDKEEYLSTNYSMIFNQILIPPKLRQK